MSYTKIKDDFIDVATSEIVGFASAKEGFLDEMNNGNLDYPLLLLMPPNATLDINKDDFEYFDIIFYTFALNRAEDGDVTNNDERTAIWDSLNQKVKTFLITLQNSKKEYVVLSKATIQPNAHNFHDDTIFLKVTFRIRLDSESC